MPQDRERPSVTWDWSLLRVTAGALSTQGEIEELVEVLNYFGERLPPGIDGALKKARKGRAKDDGETSEAQP